MVRLRVLGESVVEIGRQRLGPEASTVFALALYLAFERGARLTRQSLIELLWPDSGEERGRHCLRQTLYKLRQFGAPVRATAGHVELPGSEVTGDVLELAAGAPLDAERLRRAGSGFGEFLPGYQPRFSPRYSEWLEDRRVDVQAIVRRSLAATLLDLRGRHRWADVELVARHHLRIDPLNEEATLALAEATALTGSKAQAISMLDRYIVELGPAAGDIRLPATMLRRRIAERVPERRYSAVADACFEGREESLEVLAGLLGEARAGRGQACLIWGEAGIGKTRLAAECTKAAVLQGAQFVRVGCEASDARRPLSLFVDAVPPLLNLRGALGCSPASMSYLRRLTEHDPDAPTPSEAALDADYLFARVRRSIFDLVDAVASEGTLVFVVEDVHWLDQTSWDVLRTMIDWAATRKLLFLFTSRTEHPTGVPQDSPSLRLVRHRLGAIGDEAAGRLLDVLCEGSERALGAELREWYVRVAEGNPLFLRELAREWVEKGRSHGVPPSLATVIEERIRKLTPTALRVLQTAAMLGKQSSHARIEAVTQYARHDTVDAVVALEMASLLSPEVGVIRPRHDLVASTALAQLGTVSRQLLHRNIAMALSTEIRSSANPQLLWDCAEHWALAGDTEEISSLVTACASMLIRVGLPGDASKLYEAALRYDLKPSDRLTILRGQCDALRLAGLWSQVAKLLPEVLNIRARLGSFAPVHCAEELELLEAEGRQSGTTTTMVAQALACASNEAAATGHRLAAAVLALRFADRAGDFESATSAFSFARRVAEESDASDSVEYLTCKLIYHSSYGDLTIARQSASELVSLERRSGTPFSLNQALRYSWIPLMRLGDFARARSAAIEAYAIAEQFQLASGALSAADALADMCLEDGRIDEAATWCDTARAWTRSFEDEYLSNDQSLTQARLLLMNGDEQAARLVAPLRPSEIATDYEVRRYANALALSVRLFAEIGPVGQSRLELEQLLATQMRTRTLGGQDFGTWCLCSSMERLGERERAYSILVEYARVYRREQGPLPYYLEELLISLSNRRLGTPQTV